MLRVELHTEEGRGLTEELAARIAETQLREAAIIASMRVTGLGAGALMQLGELRAERQIYVSLAFLAS